jgi:hypothetical protein
MERIGELPRKTSPVPLVSKQRLRQAESFRLVRLKRESGNQELGYSSRPFVLCGLPVKRPPKGVLLHGRRNGRFRLQVTGIRRMVCLGARTALSPSSSLHWPPARSRLP